MFPTYLIPFDANYFLLGLSLLTTMRKQLGKLDNVCVLDFGLQEQQITFLKAYGVTVIEMAPELADCDPFKLKANLNTYLRSHSLLGRWLVLLDADMLMLKSPVQAIDALITQMQQEGQHLALCQDMGPAANVAQFVELFSWRNIQFSKCTEPFDLSVPYLNIGFVIFSPEFDFDRYHSTAYGMQREICWVQNAMNLMCLQGVSHLLLDPKQWNVHGGRLLDAFSEKDDPYILHLTSDTDCLIQKPVDLQIGGQNFTFPYRFTSNPAIQEIQDRVLESLVRENTSLFLKYFL